MSLKFTRSDWEQILSNPLIDTILSQEKDYLDYVLPLASSPEKRRALTCQLAYLERKRNQVYRIRSRFMHKN